MLKKKIGLFKLYGWKEMTAGDAVIGYEILLPLKNGLYVGENIGMDEIKRMSELQLQREIERKTELCKKGAEKL